MTADEVAGADEATWEDPARPPAPLGRRLAPRSGLPPWPGPSWLPRDCQPACSVEPAGERELTDLGHVAQLLHAEGSAGQLGAPALRAWLARRIEESASETAEAEDRSRRLDSDADAVQVLTIHRAKGLEFPIVYCPYLWDSGPALRKGQPVVFHDACRRRPAHPRCRRRRRQPRLRRPLSAAHDEQRGEDLRLLYVALTRARTRR